MFTKKCPRCGKKISRNFEFCPYCGTRLSKKEDYGFLGKDDSIDFSDFNNILGTSMPFGKLINSLFSELDKQFKELDKRMDEEKPKKISKGISISISTEPGKSPQIRVKNLGTGKIKKPVIKTIKPEQISEEDVKKIAKLPKQEAETKVRRLSNKIIYEIDLPGVKSMKNVFVNKLENSIEIKAFSKDKAYFKLIPLNLPILNYKLRKEKLILELAER